jgi:hypothetical protein
VVTSILTDAVTIGTPLIIRKEYPPSGACACLPLGHW